MKKLFLITVALIAMAFSSLGQNASTPALQATIKKMEAASSARDLKRLAEDFGSIAITQKTNWLAWYYAALCNAKVGWIYQDAGELIEPFARKGDEQIKKALSLIDTMTQKRELSEVYCVFSMVSRANVFIDPTTYGRMYGPAASQYTQLARMVDPTNPRAVFLEGWEKYSTPRMWGGDKKKGRELLQQAFQKLNAQKVPVDYPKWGKKEVQQVLRKL